MKHFLISPLKLALALTACGLISATHAAERLAAPPEFLSAQAGASADGIRWQPVGDEVLSRQTGKAPGGEMVSGLVLDLMSQWQMPGGASATAHGKLTITSNADNSLSAQVTTSAQASDGASHGNHYGSVNGNGNAGANVSANPNTNAAVAGNAGASNNTPPSSPTTAVAGNGANPQASATGGQNVSVSGVSQVTQVAGNGNTSSNSAVIDFNGSSSSTNGAGAPNGMPSVNTASASATSASGHVKADVTFASGGVALTLQTPAGVATQTITPAGIQGGGSIAQLVQVAGNAQAVVNQLQLSVQTQAMPGALLRQLGVLDALRNSALPRH
ncbi:peptidase C39 [Trinickia sp. NRRL B-1857]|uniref:peptidase C39 n=1 Tax=Trinickia sp. NRRL B-1857 TaxID=3162879 RepID=UPI003D297E3C